MYPLIKLVQEKGALACLEPFAKKCRSKRVEAEQAAGNIVVDMRRSFGNLAQGPSKPKLGPLLDNGFDDGLLNNDRLDQWSAGRTSQESDSQGNRDDSQYARATPLDSAEKGRPSNAHSRGSSPSKPSKGKKEKNGKSGQKKSKNKSSNKELTEPLVSVGNEWGLSGSE